MGALSIHGRWSQPVVFANLVAGRWQHCICLSISGSCYQDLSGRSADVHECRKVDGSWLHQRRIPSRDSRCTQKMLDWCWWGKCLFSLMFAYIHYSRSLPPSLLLTPNALLLHLRIATSQSHLRASSRSNSSGRLSQTFSAIPQLILPLSSGPPPTQNARRSL